MRRACPDGRALFLCGSRLSVRTSALGGKQTFRCYDMATGDSMPRLSCTLALCAALVASTSFAQTDKSASSGMSEAETKAYTEAFDKAFRTAFRVKSVNQCVASAPNAAAAGFDITPSCACVSETLLATKSVKQLQELNTTDPNNEGLKTVVASCL